MIFSLIAIVLGTFLFYFIFKTFKNLSESKSAFHNLILRRGVRDAFKVLVIGMICITIAMGARLFSNTIANIVMIIAAFFQIACFYILSRITE